MAKKASKNKKANKKVVKAKKVAERKKSAPSKPKKTASKKVIQVVKKTKKPVKKAKPLKVTAKKVMGKPTKKKHEPAEEIVTMAIASKKKTIKPLTPAPKSLLMPEIKKAGPQDGSIVKEKVRPVKQKAPPKKKIIKAPTIVPGNLAAKPLSPSNMSKKNEPKGKFELEFVIRSSPTVLFEFLSTPSGLSEWFADDVNVREDIYTFFWDGSEQQARIIALKDEEYIRLQWLEKKDGSYFEFRVVIDELTSDVSLIITDFAENESEKASSKLLWQSQIDKLLHVLGSYF